MTKIIAVINQKGGVGKTSTCIHVSENLSLSHNVLLIDLEPSINSTKVFNKHIGEYNIKNVLEDKNFNIKNAVYNTYMPNLQIIPSHISLAILQGHLESRIHKEKILKKQLDKLNNKYDYIIIDCPPLLTVFSTIAVYCADFILIPTDYEIDALDGIADLFKVMKEVKEDQNYDYRILRNKRDERKTISIHIVKEILEPLIGKVFKTIISQNSSISNAKSEQKTVFKYSPLSEAAREYENLVLEIKKILND